MDLKELKNNDIVRHPWESSRKNFVIKLIKRYLAVAPLNILDMGSGDAYFAKHLLSSLSNNSKITCWDIAYDKYFLSKHIDDNPFFIKHRPSQTFNLLLLMDVMEHIEDDATCLTELVKENSSDGGYILITVPAWQFLYSAHDKALGHYRRYSPKRCLNVIQQAGLSPIVSGGLYHSLLLLRFFTKIRELIKPIDKEEIELSNLGNWKGGKFKTRLITYCLKIDNALSNIFAKIGLNIPGLSFWVLCQHQDKKPTVS